MSAAFEFKGYLCWGSSGMIENYLERMTSISEIATGLEDKLSLWLAHQHQVFYLGAVVLLDDILTGDKIAAQFVFLLDKATQDFLESGRFNEIGQQWLREEIPKLRTQILKR